jgi:hypothetical protein
MKFDIRMYVRILSRCEVKVPQINFDCLDGKLLESCTVRSMNYHINGT